MKGVTMTAAEEVKQAQANQSAFPQLSHSAPTGMLLRDYFAAQAMLGMIVVDKIAPPKLLAEMSYDIARAMLAARE